MSEESKISVGSWHPRNHNTTDCRSEEGISVGLVDALISVSRVLAPRLRSLVEKPYAGYCYGPLTCALADLKSDEDVQFVMNGLVAMDNWAPPGSNPHE